MDGGSGPLYGAAELECEDAEDETQQGDGQSYLGDQLESKGVLHVMAGHQHCETAEMFT